MTHMNETAKRYADTYGVENTVAETIETLSKLIGSIAHQSPYGHYQSPRIYDDIADACIHLEMMAYIATNDATQKAVVDIIHNRLKRLDIRLDVIKRSKEKWQPSTSTE